MQNAIMGSGASVRQQAVNAPGAEVLLSTGTPGRLGTYLSGARNLLTTPNVGLGAPDGVAPTAAMQSFKYRRGVPSPGAPGALFPAWPTSNPTSTANQRQVHVYRCVAPSATSIVYLPGQNELVLLYRGRTVNEPSVRAKLPGRPQLGAPAIALNPIAWNYFMALKQKELFEQDRDLYNKLTPADLMTAPKDVPDLPDWCGWSFAGGVIVEETSDALSSRDTDGYALQNLGTGRVSGLRGADATKMLGVVTAGRLELLDVALGRGMCEGATLWWYVRRAKLGENGGTKQSYTLSHKAGTLLAADAEVRPPPIVAPTNKEGDKYPFRPMQMGFFMMPDGSDPSPMVRQSEDERGQMHYDGVYGRVGRVLFAPAHMGSYLPPPDNANLRPLTDGFELMRRDRAEVILDADMSGLLTCV